ncbi:MAG TPA: lysophospholipid acyltransferase family protein [Solirubrobacterales bacterium]
MSADEGAEAPPADGPADAADGPRGLGGRPFGADSPLFGGPPASEPAAGAEEATPPAPGYDPHHDEFASERPLVPAAGADEEAALDRRDLLPAHDGERSLDDWGRDERVLGLADPVLNFYYRYWFRVEVEGIENIPSAGGALLVSNHSGALPPDAPMIMQAIRNEAERPRPLYMLGEHWFKGYPGVGMLANKLGLVPGHPANALRLLRDEGRLAIVFPEGQKGSRKVLWQRYRLRRFGRGGFVRTALRAGVPIVPIALVGGEEAMPIFAHLRLAQRISGLIYFPLNHAFPHFGLAAGAMYLPAKFRIHFLEPIDLSGYPPETIEDAAEVQAITERIRGRIQSELDSMLAARKSVWTG